VTPQGPWKNIQGKYGKRTKAGNVTVQCECSVEAVPDRIPSCIEINQKKKPVQAKIFIHFDGLSIYLSTAPESGVRGDQRLERPSISGKKKTLQRHKGGGTSRGEVSRMRNKKIDSTRGENYT